MEILKWWIFIGIIDSLSWKIIENLWPAYRQTLILYPRRKHSFFKKFRYIIYSIIFWPIALLTRLYLSFILIKHGPKFYANYIKGYDERLDEYKRQRDNKLR